MSEFQARRVRDCRTEDLGGGRAEEWSVRGERGQAAITLTPDVDGIGSGSLLEPDVCSHL